MEQAVDHVAKHLHAVGVGGGIGINAGNLPRHPVIVGVGAAAKKTKLAVGDIHDRVPGRDAVGREAGARQNVGPDRGQRIRVGSVGVRVPRSDLGAVDVQGTVVGLQIHRVGAGRGEAQEPQLVDIAAHGAAVERQGRTVLDGQIGAQEPDFIDRIHQDERRAGQGGGDFG